MSLHQNFTASFTLKEKKKKVFFLLEAARNMRNLETQNIPKEQEEKWLKK